MIPEDLDDGFTVEVAPELFCRPMMSMTRFELRGLSEANMASVVFNPPYTWGHIPESLYDEVALAVLAGRDEWANFHALSHSVELQVLAPGMSVLSCRDCREFSVDHSTGEIQRDQLGRPKPIPGGVNVPCETHIGCLKGHWKDPRGLSCPRWARTWNHFWKYRDVPEFRLSDDPIFRRNLLLLNWTMNYGRNPAFDPFIGGSPRRGTDAGEASGTS